MSEKKSLHEDVQESMQKIWLAGLGALAAAEEESSKLFQTLVERGEDYQKRGRAEVEKVKEAVEDAAERVEEGAEKAAESAKSQVENLWDKVEDRFDDLVAGALRRAGVPSRDEIAKLTERVEALTNAVRNMQGDAQGEKSDA